MKHYLLTWYGTTDMRAALGLEPTDGPILSALKTRNYTDVVILAYTNPDKAPDGFTDEIRTEWEHWRAADLETRLRVPRDRAQRWVDVLMNTDRGHELFACWLKTELAKNGIACNVQLIPWKLAHLNDARSICDAAVSAVNRVLADRSEKTITTYISPGTPVMAYTWALIARAHPQHKIAVIASSEPRLPPETVDLPRDFLTPFVAEPERAKTDEYDAIIHLLGRERIPIYFGMLQFRAALHIFITTDGYRDAAEALSRCRPPACRCSTVIIPDPFTPAATQRAIERQISRLPGGARVAVNLTGGTKLMFAGALAACWERGLEPFYFEINKHNVIFIRDGMTIPFVGARSVADYFAVNGFRMLANGRWEERPCRAARLDVTKKLWMARRTLGQLYRKPTFRRYPVPWGGNCDPPFVWEWGKSRASFTAEGNAELVLDGDAIPIPRCNDYGRYLSGGWFEEYVFKLLREIEVKGVIHDLRIGIEVGYWQQQSDGRPCGEFDCAFTDGRRLWLVECKAGGIKQEHIQKLENNLRTYGGTAAAGILVSAFPIVGAHAKRVSSSMSICSVADKEVRAEVLERIITTWEHV